jgi:chromosomal replication initiation ATPase DnaA
MRTVPSFFCKTYIDSLEGTGFWDGMSPSEQEFHTIAFKQAWHRCFRHHTTRLEHARDVCAEALQIPNGVLVGYGRSTTQSFARQVVSYCLRYMVSPTPSWPEIASALGRSHHSSAMNTVTACEQKIERDDKAMVAAIEKCRKALKQASNKPPVLEEVAV